MNYQAAVITVSDKGARGERIDTSGPALKQMLTEAGFQVTGTAIVPDEKDQIKKELLHCVEKGIALILTTGGTGFSPRDITPEATLEILERRTPGLCEAMRAESMKVTKKGCLSRGEAGICGRSLIVNLPGSEKAARENFAAVQEALLHGLDMLYSEGSADCGKPERRAGKAPSMDLWLREAKEDKGAPECGMYLFHNGVVRQTAKANVRQGISSPGPVTGMLFSYDREKVAAAVKETYRMPGIRYVRVWLNEGCLSVGDDIMLVLIGGDIRPHVVDALQALVSQIKEHCVEEKELF